MAQHEPIGQELRISTLPLLFLALPFLEIAGFVVVGRHIGALATVGLVLASTVAGSMLLRHQGFGVMRRVQAEIEAKRDPSRQLVHGAIMVLASVLLIVPGFITDLFALLLLLPPVRDFAWRALKSRVVVAGNFGMPGFGGGFRRRDENKTIDLDNDDFSRDGAKPDPNSPWRRLKDE
ncbi:FxsA family protein [Mesorhizobium sp. A623]